MKRIDAELADEEVEVGDLAPVERSLSKHGSPTASS
jgi:hypothetical protein